MTQGQPDASGKRIRTGNLTWIASNDGRTLELETGVRLVVAAPISGEMLAQMQSQALRKALNQACAAAGIWPQAEITRLEGELSAQRVRNAELKAMLEGRPTPDADRVRELIAKETPYLEDQKTSKGELKWKAAGALWAFEKIEAALAATPAPKGEGWKCLGHGMDTPYYCPDGTCPTCKPKSAEPPAMGASKRQQITGAEPVPPASEFKTAPAAPPAIREGK